MAPSVVSCQRSALMRARLDRVKFRVCRWAWGPSAALFDRVKRE
jgi:hypothetical protein